MADIVALSALNVSTTVNGVVVRLTRGRLRINGVSYQFLVTGQTKDADGKAWMNTLAGGANSWDLEADGYIDYNLTPANRLTGDAIKLRPGTTAAGAFVVLLAPSYGFGGTLVVETFEANWDAEGQKPVACRVGGKGDGALTYINA